MILRFPYLDERLTGPPPPTLPPTATVRWRPLVPVTIFSASGLSFRFGRAVIDPGADDSVFPMDLAKWLHIRLHPATGGIIRWRGQVCPIRFGEIDLQLADDDGAVLRWHALVAFTATRMTYPLLGTCGSLQFMNVRLMGADHIVEIEPNASCPIVQ